MSGDDHRIYDFDAKVTDLVEWRKRALSGEAVLDLAERDPAFKAELLARMDATLTDPNDRALFGLAPLPAE